MYKCREKWYNKPLAPITNYCSFNNYQLMANPISSIPHSLLTSTQINGFHFLKL